MRKKLFTLIAFLLTFVMLSTSACGPQATPTPTKVPPTATKAPVVAPTQAPTAAPTAIPTKVEVSEVEKITVGVGPFTAHASLYAADKLGYFKAEGLTVELQQASGAMALSLVQAGKLHFAGAGASSVIQGRYEGFDFMPVITASVMRKEATTALGLVIKTDSPIKGPKDLEGKRIATTELNNIIWLYVRAVVKKYGGDPDKMRWVEMSYANMSDALLNNQIDVAATTEPFITPLLETGKTRYFISQYHEIEPGLQVAFWTGSEKWIKEHPIATKKFYRALSRANDYLNQNPAEKRKYTLEWTKMNPALFDKLIPEGPWENSINIPMLQRGADLMLEGGLIKTKVDASKIVYKP